MKEGWYDGGSIAFAVLLVIIVTGMEFCSCHCFPYLNVSIACILDTSEKLMKLTITWVVRWIIKMHSLFSSIEIKTQNSNSNKTLVPVKVGS